MLELTLLAIAWGVDPVVIEPRERSVMNSAATMFRPAAILVQPRPVCAVPATLTGNAVTFTCLSRWEQASRGTAETARSQREEFRRRLHDEFNEHTAIAVEQLLGRVKVQNLVDSFDWRFIERKGDQVCLEAIPRDQIERLFYGSLRVSLDAASWTAQSIVVINRNQIERIVWQSDNPPVADLVRLVQFEDGVLPAPSETLRTANSRVEERQ